MGFLNEDFVGNPNRQELVEDGEELEYISDDEISFIPYGLQPGDPDNLLLDNYDIDDDDVDYNPADDYEDFLSDSDDEFEFGDGEEDAWETGMDADEDSSSDSESSAEDESVSPVKANEETTVNDKKVNEEDKSASESPSIPQNETDAET